MLAPRKKLWSTPTEAIEMAGKMVSLSLTDVLYDVGCGDGRVLVHLASTTNCQNFVGIEIDMDRAQEARENIELARTEGRFRNPDVKIDIYCANALEISHYHKASVIFLYLVPRGLRIIHPILLRASIKRRHQKQDDSELPEEHKLIVDNNSKPSLTNLKSYFDDNKEKFEGAAANLGPSLFCENKNCTGIRVVTYMAGFEGEIYIDKQRCAVKHQSGAAWPIYCYYFDGKTPLMASKPK